MLWNLRRVQTAPRANHKVFTFHSNPSLMRTDVQNHDGRPRTLRWLSIFWPCKMPARMTFFAEAGRAIEQFLFLLPVYTCVRVIFIFNSNSSKVIRLVSNLKQIEYASFYKLKLKILGRKDERFVNSFLDVENNFCPSFEMRISRIG